MQHFLEATITMSHGTQLHPTQLYCQNSKRSTHLKWFKLKIHNFHNFITDMEATRCHGSDKSQHKISKTSSFYYFDLIFINFNWFWAHSSSSMLNSAVCTPQKSIQLPNANERIKIRSKHLSMTSPRIWFSDFQGDFQGFLFFSYLKISNRIRHFVTHLQFWPFVGFVRCFFAF